VTKDRVTIQEAARRLRVKDDAIRKRIQRGSLDHEKDPDGRVYVYLDAAHDNSHDAYKDSTRYLSQDDPSRDTAKDESYAAVVDTLQDQVQYLRSLIVTRDRELEVRTEELRRKDTIIMALTQRVPELEAEQEPRDGPVTASDDAAKGAAPAGTQEPPESHQRSWWRRFFGL
jgi:hypothetical protein